jgi:hypothetical protein
MPTLKYQLPTCLIGHCEPRAYSRWLRRKAAAHRRRDRKRGNADATIEAYRVAIHAAVELSGGKDAYTGHALRWDLISKYDNEQSKAGKRAYKQSFGDLPSVDHVGDGLGAPDFRICAWRTNDAKNDLSYDEFIALCRHVIAHHEDHQG